MRTTQGTLLVVVLLLSLAVLPARDELRVRPLRSTPSRR